MPCAAPSGWTHLRNHAKDVKPSRLRKRECFAGPSSAYASPPPSNLRSPHMLSFRTIPASVKGVWGLSPHVYHSPCPSTPMPTDRPMSTIALCLSPLAISTRRTRFLPALSHSHTLVMGVWGLSPHVHRSSFPPACPFLPELTEISYLGLVKKMPTD